MIWVPSAPSWSAVLNALAPALLLLCANSGELFAASELTPRIQASLTAAAAPEKAGHMESAVISAIAQRPDQVDAIVERAVALMPRLSQRIVASASRAFPAFANRISAAAGGARPGRDKTPDPINSRNLAALAEPDSAGNWWNDGWSVTVYSGRLSTSDTSEIFVGDIEFEDAGIVGAALNKELATSWEHLVWEAEVQANQFFGDQDHLELNALFLARWTSFPWNEWVRTTFALGDGLSYATQTPELESAKHDNSAKLLNYVVGELTFAPPSSEHLSMAIRYHHRSGTLGLFSGVNEASTIFGLGLKYRF